MTSTSPSVLILGGGSQIAQSLVRVMEQRFEKPSFYLLGRKEQGSSQMTQYMKLNIFDESSWRQVFEDLYKQCQSFDYVISCLGTLATRSQGPEKSLKDINLDNIQETFVVNTFSAAMLAKYFEPFYSLKREMVLMYLSAKVGSISDNRLGGWYSYRSSKAALNMLVKNMAIEFERRKKKVKVLAVHPGTTKTSLSEKYLKNISHRVWTSDETAEHLCDILLNSSHKSGSFLNWDQSLLEW